MGTKAEKTKSFIIECAARLFNRQGVAATSLHDIINETGLTKGAIYGHFKDKDQIALAAFQYNSAFLLHGFSTYTSSVKGTRNKLRAMLKFYGDHAEWLLQNGGCPVLNTTTEQDDNPGTMQLAVRSVIDDWRTLFVTILNNGIDSGELRQDCDPTRFANTFIAMIEGGIMFTQLYRSPAVLIDIFDQIDHIIVTQLSESSKIKQ